MSWADIIRLIAKFYRIKDETKIVFTNYLGEYVFLQSINTNNK